MASIPHEALSLGSPWQGERIILVRTTDAIRLCRDDGYQGLPFHRAVDFIERLGRRDMAVARSFVARARLYSFPLQNLDDAGLRALLRGKLRAGDLAVVREGGGKGEDASDGGQRRLVREIEAKSQRRLGYAGRQYRLVPDSRLGRLADRDYYEVVSHRDAVGVLHALAGQSGDVGLARLLTEAAGMLTRDWRPPLQPDGLVLLRRIIVKQASKPDLEPALTPSQIKKLAKSDWIEVELVDEDGEPYSTNYKLELTDQSLRQGRFGEDGFLGVYEIESGTCKLVIGEVKEAAAAAEEDEASVVTPPPTETVPPTDSADLGEEAAFDVDEVIEAEAESSTEEEFSIKVVDEAGNPIAAVPMAFRWSGGEETVPTGSDGIAACLAAAEAVNVSFESAESLADVLSRVWASRTPTPSENYLPTSDEVTAVTSRPAAIELADASGAFNPVSLEPGRMLIFSVRPAKKRVVFLEMHEALFRTNSAVVMPQGDAPGQAPGPQATMPTAGFIATILRYNQEHEGKKLFIAGHTDTKGSDEFNQPLSEERAQAVLALLLGDRDAFASLCMNRHDDVDLTQIFHWCADSLGLDCKPTRYDTAPSEKTIRKFQEGYGFWQEQLGADAYPPLAVTGKVDLATWKAIFDCYEHHLRWALDEDAAGVAASRAKLVWVDDSRKSLGFGEKWPVDKPGVNNRRSQSNRRVEVLMFDRGEEPDLAAAEADPATSEIYTSGVYDSEPVDPYPAARKTIWLRIAMDPATAATCEDQFTLSSTDGTVRTTQRVADRPMTNDETVDLQFADLDTSCTYELSLQQPGMATPQPLTGAMTAGAVALGPDPEPAGGCADDAVEPASSPSEVAYV